MLWPKLVLSPVALQSVTPFLTILNTEVSKDDHNAFMPSILDTAVYSRLKELSFWVHSKKIVWKTAEHTRRMNNMLAVNII